MYTKLSKKPHTGVPKLLPAFANTGEAGWHGRTWIVICIKKKNKNQPDTKHDPSRRLRSVIVLSTHWAQTLFFLLLVFFSLLDIPINLWPRYLRVSEPFVESARSSLVSAYPTNISLYIYCLEFEKKIYIYVCANNKHRGGCCTLVEGINPLNRKHITETCTVWALPVTELH